MARPTSSGAEVICRVAHRKNRLKTSTPLLILLNLAWLFSACQIAPSKLPAALPAWQLADLRALDPADAPSPEQDLVALSLRHIQGQVQIRLDWLELGLEQAGEVRLDFYTGREVGNSPAISTDCVTGCPTCPATAKQANSAVCPTEPKLSIKLLTNGGIWSSEPLPGLRAQWDSFYDTTLITFQDKTSWLHAGYYVSALVSDPVTANVLDEIGPVLSNGASPPAQAIILAFWNTFTAVTPAQALRQWDGAHSGPLRDRHGLRHLLAASESTHTPIFLLDAKTPAALSALDAVGGLESLQKLASAGVVILPNAANLNEAAPGWLAMQALAESRQVGLDFGLAASPFAYTAQAAAPGYAVWFSFDEKSDGSVQRCLGGYFIPLAGSPTPGLPASPTFTPQATNQGPSLEVRRQLADAFLHSGYTLLGGDFAADTWGMPQAATATLRYLAARPWLKVLDAIEAQQLTATSDGCTQQSLKMPDPNLESVLAELARTPDNPLQQAARQMVETLLTPAAPRLTELRQGYVGQVGHLLAAARWAATPYRQADCSQDLDWDGAAECVLASETIFAVVEPNGGYISVAAALVNGEAHQIIAPSWQLVAGLSDAMDWKPERGVMGDPAAIPGGFFDPADKWRSFQAEAGAGKVVLRDAEGSKTFQISGDGRLVVRFTGNAGQRQAISLGLDAWERFRPGWAERYSAGVFDQGWGWGLAPGLTIQLEAGEASFESTLFRDSLPFLRTPEDPNFAYPAGHYLPFPLAVVTVEGAEKIEMWVR